jgi:hypothetical protein
MLDFGGGNWRATCRMGRLPRAMVMARPTAFTRDPFVGQPIADRRYS